MNTAEILQIMADNIYILPDTHSKAGFKIMGMEDAAEAIAAPSGEGEKMAEDFEEMKSYAMEKRQLLLMQIELNVKLQLENIQLRRQLEAGKAPESTALIPTDEELEDMVMDGYAKTDKNKERVRVAKVVRDRIAERFKAIQSNK